MKINLNSNIILISSIISCIISGILFDLGARGTSVGVGIAAGILFFTAMLVWLGEM